MTVTFLGLYGTTGVLPRHYTHRLLEIDQYTRGDAGRPLRDWLDLFNHRWVWQFYRAWEKYRFWLAYERGEPARHDRTPSPGRCWPCAGWPPAACGTGCG